MTLLARAQAARRCAQCTEPMPTNANGATRRARFALALLAVIPAPREAVESPGAFELATGTEIRVEGGTEATQVAAQLMERLAAVPGIAAKLRVGGAAPTHHVVRLRLQPAAAIPPEGYRLVVTPDAIDLEASDVAGLRYGTVTLWQLAAGSAESGRADIPAVRIEDSPRFRWRGLMLDSARHYQSPEFIERYLDWMALHKFNVLHWHLTDDQAWRLEIRRYPRLTSVGAWRVPAGRAAQRDLDPATGKPRLYGGFYSQDTVRRIVRYAAERNITVVPEIEMPGHASATVAAYPELGAGAAAEAVPADWGVYANLFNVEESTFAFLENVLREVLELFPGTYIHVGGDEAVKDQWRTSPRVQARMRELGIADEAALQSYFVQRVGRFLAANGRQLIGWDEILEGGLAPEAHGDVVAWCRWRARRGAGRARRRACGLAHAVFRQPPRHRHERAAGPRPCRRPGGCVRVRHPGIGPHARAASARDRRAGQPLDRACPHRGTSRVDDVAARRGRGRTRLVAARAPRLRRFPLARHGRDDVVPQGRIAPGDQRVRCARARSGRRAAQPAA